MKPTDVETAAQKAEQRVRIAVEQVKSAEKRARTAKDKAWRTKLQFKLARRAFRKAKRAAKRAREKAVQAQIASKELTEQIARLTPPRVRTRSAAPTSRRNRPPQSSAVTRRKQSAVRPMASVKPLPGISGQARSAPTGSEAQKIRRQSAARSAKARPPAIEGPNQTGTESVSTQPGAAVAEEELTRFGDFDEAGIRSGQPARES